MPFACGNSSWNIRRRADVADQITCFITHIAMKKGAELRCCGHCSIHSPDVALDEYFHLYFPFSIISQSGHKPRPEWTHGRRPDGQNFSIDRYDQRPGEIDCSVARHPSVNRRPRLRSIQQLGRQNPAAAYCLLYTRRTIA